MESNISIDSTESTTSPSISQNQVTKILIVEDHQLTRYGIRFALEKYKTLEIIGEAENGEIALRIAMEEKPDIVLMDIGLPVMDGIEATQLIKKYLPQTKIVMLTSKEDASNIYTALGAGADSYCLKDISTEMLVKVIEMSLQGVLWLDPAIAKVVVQGLPSNADHQTTEAYQVKHASPTEGGDLKPSKTTETFSASPANSTDSKNTLPQNTSSSSSSAKTTDSNAGSNPIPLGQAIAEEAANLSLLSPREVKILSMIVDTKCLKDIAEAFHKTPDQMNQEIVAILQKLAVEKYSNLNSPQNTPKHQ
ncbi:MAG: response regulator transcription factor, partial [Cyanobacteria bacterium]|nr:response regulator transcription factor [Cyanobacteriota bacterium]